MSDEHDAVPPPPDAPPSPDAPAVATQRPVQPHPQPPRAGQLTFGWRVVTVVTWIGVVIAFAAVWNASVQLGLSTWWLGPRAQPQSRVVQFLPFVPGVVVLLAAVNNLRRLPWIGIAAAVGCVAIGLGDVGRVDTLAAVELAIAGAALVVSIASLTGVYRSGTSPVPEPATQQPSHDPSGTASVHAR